MPSQNEKAVAFRALHQTGTFVIPNPWDIGTARLLAHLGFAALATTSAGFAFSRGRPDGAVTRIDPQTHDPRGRVPDDRHRPAPELGLRTGEYGLQAHRHRSR